jgi:hypothetical protein
VVILSTLIPVEVLHLKYSVNNKNQFTVWKDGLDIVVATLNTPP